MMALLSPRVWLALALAGVLALSHGFMYRAGKANARAECDAKDVAERLERSEASRRDEKARTIANQKVDHALQIAKTRRAAADRVTADRLRDFEAASAAVSADSTTASGTDDPYRAIANQCAASLVILDRYASEVAGKAGALQDYAREVCVKP